MKTLMPYMLVTVGAVALGAALWLQEPAAAYQYYGNEGHMIAGEAASLPVFAAVSTTAPVVVWSTNTADVRALQRPTSGRIAAAWQSSEVLTIDVTIGGTEAHRVSLYVLDWDRKNRRQRFDLVDGGNGALRDSRTTGDFSEGVYYTWAVSGPIRINVTRLGGPSAVVSGVFIDPVDQPPLPSPSVLPVCGPNQVIGNPPTCRCLTQAVGNPRRCKP